MSHQIVVRKVHSFDGLESVARTNASGTVTRMNIFAPDGLVASVTSGNWTICTFDPQGSVAQRLNSSQAITSSSYYDAYGQEYTTGAPSDPFGYNANSGYYLDRQTGKYLLGHRYYDWSQGRFLNRDPFGQGGGINLYGYCQSSPIERDDADGEASIVRVNPWGPLYGHAFIWINHPCLGKKSFGFWPNYAKPLGWPNFNCGYEAQIRSPANHDRVSPHDPVSPEADLVDPSDVYEHQLNNDDPEFEAALCDCVKESLRRRQYFTVGSVCGTWANGMWDCARKRYWAKKGQFWRALPPPDHVLGWAL